MSSIRPPDRVGQVVEQALSLAELFAGALPPTHRVAVYDLRSARPVMLRDWGSDGSLKVDTRVRDAVALVERNGPDAYRARLPASSGAELDLSVSVWRDEDGVAVLAVALVSDPTPWQQLRDLAAAFLNESSADEMRADAEELPDQMDELAEFILRSAIAQASVPVELMRKEHKMKIVLHLRDRGIFKLRDSVQMVADALGVTRFTVYNYLNEADETDA